MPFASGTGANPVRSCCRELYASEMVVILFVFASIKGEEESTGTDASWLVSVVLCMKCCGELLSTEFGGGGGGGDV